MSKYGVILPKTESIHSQGLLECTYLGKVTFICGSLLSFVCYQPDPKAAFGLHLRKQPRLLTEGHTPAVGRDIPVIASW